MRFYSPNGCARHGRSAISGKVPLIADEIATGFGRSGELFACNHAGISPDIMCLARP